MRKGWQTRVKKLALAYGTGWEYTPGGEEAGSVLTDIFLDMAEENLGRYERIWEKQEQVFQKAVPERKRRERELSGELAVKVSDEEHGYWLEDGTEAYRLTEQGTPDRFRTARPLQLTSARLCYAVYCRGLCAWLSYDAEEGEESSLALFHPEGKELSHPVFRWYFQNLCDGMADFKFTVEFLRTVCPAAALPGQWTVSDGETVFPADWKQTDSGILLEGQTPGFAGNLERRVYEICLELSPEEELTEEWMETLCGGYILRTAAEERETELCVTDFGAGEGDRILPFGTSLEEASCCYLSCDRIMAGEENEILIRFREGYLTEERLPEPSPGESERLYKKYPWLRRMETVQEWQAENTLWEYFNGSLWRILPGSEAWMTGCHAENAGEKAYWWRRPRDMSPCVVEGEEHFYIRLRLAKVRNAYAMYYRKVIPVLEEVRFSGKERCLRPVRQELPDYRETKTERMYLGFDRDVTPDNCWYTGEGVCSFDREMIKGKSIRFGREAFWVEWREKREEKLTCFLPNFVPVRRIPDKVDSDSADYVISAGEPFYLEPHSMGILDAVCLKDIRCKRTEDSVLSDRQTAENYFSHFGRLLTPGDMELMLQESYPMLQVRSCVFRQEGRILEVELANPGSSGDGVSGMLPEESAEVSGRLPEIGNWLKEILSMEGPVWLRECSVHCSLSEG